jgi:DNA-directed RNA polymerase subunit E'/Rpb7
MAEPTLETVIFFEKKISITPKELNELKTKSVDEMVLKKAKNMVENKCSEHGFILPGSVALISRSMGYFESARFTGDSNYYVKLQGKVLYPVDGLQLTGTVIRRNKMGLYVNYNDAIHIQVPRDLHIGNELYDTVQIGERVIIELKRSKFAINDPFILSSGRFISREGGSPSSIVEDVENAEEEDDAEEEEESEVEPEAEEESDAEEEEKSEETAPPITEPLRTFTKPVAIESIKRAPIVNSEDDSEDESVEPVPEPVVEPVSIKEGGAKKRRSKGKQV